MKGREDLRAGPPDWEDSPHPQPATLLVSDRFAEPSSASSHSWDHTVCDKCHDASSVNTAHPCFSSLRKLCENI